MDNKYDVVIIGTGLSTLTAANLLAKNENKKVLVLDQHYFSGCYAISFGKQKDKVDISIHQIDNITEEIKCLDKKKTIFFIFEISPKITTIKKELIRMGFYKENIFTRKIILKE